MNNRQKRIRVRYAYGTQEERMKHFLCSRQSWTYLLAKKVAKLIA